MKRPAVIPMLCTAALSVGAAVIGAGAWPVMGAAAPAILYDSGRTEPLAPYRARVEVAEEGGAQPVAPPLSLPTPGQGTAPLAQLLPVHSPSLKPCPLRSIAASRSALQHLKTPFFALGADPFSHLWLGRNRAKLQSLQAVGLVVEAATEAEFNAVRAAAPRLLVVPTSGETLASALGLRCYPVLVTPEGVFQ